MNVTSGHHVPHMLRQVKDDISNITITRYATVAGVVIIIYDYLLTIDDEVGVRHTQ